MPVQTPVMNKKAVALLSGGLDSTVAVRLLLEQGIEITAVNFKTPFCCCNRTKGCGNEAARVAKEFGIPVKLIYVDKEYLEMVRAPRFGYGSGINPCLDCRIFMHKRAAAFMEEIGATFLITGEVLGQRPMSQRRDAMRLIDRESGLAGRILRPLSAGLLEPTLPEEQGIVDRARLLSIAGRSRKAQMALAREYSITDYPCPAGGCLLTDKGFAARLKDLFDHSEEISMTEVRLLRVGRHFRISPDLKLAVGRDKHENERIEALVGDTYPTMVPGDFTGPTAAAVGRLDAAGALTAARILYRYGHARGRRSPLHRRPQENPAGV